MRRRQADVARERELGRARASGAVERRDHDLRQRLDRVVETVRHAHELEDLILGVAPTNDGIQDAHREERGAAAGDDDRVSPFIDAEAVDEPLQGQEHVPRQPILIVRSVQGDRHRATIALDADFLGS